MDPWVIFDADNTLRETESLYDDARRMLTGILASRRIDAAAASEMQQAIDAELYKTFGYSAQRFPAELRIYTLTNKELFHGHRLETNLPRMRAATDHIVEYSQRAIMLFQRIYQERKLEE